MAHENYSISGQIVDVVGKQIFPGVVFIEQGEIVSIEKCDQVDDQYILPGFIDSHIHIESSMLVPSRFAELAVAQGTVATVSDPHEIANVLGVEGVNFMIRNGNSVPFKFFFGAPSCVPATSFEHSGAVISSDGVAELMARDDIYYLSEMMNFPGVINDDPEIVAKLAASSANSKPVDGHAPALSGQDLQKYADAGITTDHESFGEEEAIEKIKMGIKLQIREGSAAKNFEALYKLIDRYPDDVMLCSDDLHPDDLARGHINLLVKRALEKGMDFFNTIRTVTYNPVKHYDLPVGLLQKGDSADMVVVDNLESMSILSTYVDGTKVFDGEKFAFLGECSGTPNLFNCTAPSLADFQIKCQQPSKIKVIEAMNGELLTNQLVVEALIEDGSVVSDIENDVLKIAVLNRYQPAKPALGFIKGFNLKRGAIASSIAHDSHNIVAVGSDDECLQKAITRLIENKGGIVLYDGNEFHQLILPVAGLMSVDQGGLVAEAYEKLNTTVKEIGCRLDAPFMTLSFMALLVIPSLKIGDKGLFDVTKFQPTSLFV